MIATSSHTVQASPGASPVAVLTLSGSNGSATSGSSALAGYNVEFFRYPAGGGQPVMLTQSQTGSSGQVSLYDPALATAISGQCIEYSVVVTRVLPSNVTEMVGSYFWSTYIQGTTYQTQLVSMNLNSAVPMQLQQQSNPQTGQSSCTGLQQGCWVYIATYANVWTTIGEAHATGYMTNEFTYGTSSSDTTSVELTTGSGWSVDGSSTNSASESTNWPLLYGGDGYYSNTQFAYEDDEWYVCNPLDWNGYTCPVQDYLATSEYVVYAVYWQGSDEAWLDAGTSTSLPGDCLSLSTIQSDGLSWEEYAANTQHTITTANGYYYSVGATITSPYGGPSVSFTSTTAYNQHTTEAFSFQSQYSYYYLYANSYYSGQDTNWPIVFSSNTAC
jgi:hypothetical protein